MGCRPKSLLAGVAVVAAALSCKPTTADTAGPDDALERMEGGSGSSAAGTSEQDRLDQLYGKRADLGPRPTAKETCEGTGDQKQCKLVDPNPPLSAAHGVRELMAQYRWGMDPPAVLEQITTQIKVEFDKNASSDPMKQDEQRRELDSTLEELKSHHVAFSSPDAQRWKATLLKNLYTDSEEMVWYGTADLRQYYMFSEGKLWHVGYAYSRRTWPKKTYAKVIDEVFKPKFGANPVDKEERDARSGELLLRYFEWESSDGERIRAYDLLAGHGVLMISVVRSEVEDKLGKRLPENEMDPALQGGEDLDEVLKAEGICYDDNGDMVHDPEFCKKREQEKSK